MQYVWKRKMEQEAQIPIFWPPMLPPFEVCSQRELKSSWFEGLTEIRFHRLWEMHSNSEVNSREWDGYKACLGGQDFERYSISLWRMNFRCSLIIRPKKGYQERGHHHHHHHHHHHDDHPLSHHWPKCRWKWQMPCPVHSPHVTLRAAIITFQVSGETMWIHKPLLTFEMSA